MKCPVVSHHRHFASVDHNPSAHFGLAGQFDHMSMLYKRIQIQANGRLIVTLRNNRESVLLTLDRFLAPASCDCTIQ